MNKKIAIISITTLLSAFSVSSATLDFREEYKHDQKDWAGRVKIGGSAGNNFFGVEIKHTGNLSDLESGDNEFEYGYKYTINNKIKISPGVLVNFGDTSVTYKPQVRLEYSFDNGVTTKIRYRHEIRNYSAGNTSKGRNGESHDSLDRSKLTGNITYQWAFLQFDFEANYAEDFINKEWKMGNNDKYEWDYNLKVGYKNSSKWRPYIELGNVQCTSSTDCGSSRQLRSRVGVTYSF
ncbi:oligogalacturonate-specific porin KdgM family protein [Yersinia pseudotuberculosis]|uniref:oligogalacturonate-specific porin KdgM family protein n=1 Tax=Yersinia pseudotuberculosis TaxID=633 RepID=UPI001AA02290|nr:oligogalacturonate-specific porin KdgM family protein [Yersinia pseudotuberculosis]MBO1591103.1 porin [Yersinia pseudotuberculosis]